MTNQELIEKYPFLRMRNAWTGEPLDEDITWLDVMPIGWRKAFGIFLCDDLLEALKESGVDPAEFQILELKEKYAELRIYHGGAPQQVYDVLDKYQYVSRHVCYNCGKLNVPIYGRGYSLPLCEKCAKEARRQGMQLIEEANMKPEFTVTRYSQDKKETITMNVSSILGRIRYADKMSK